MNSTGTGTLGRVAQLRENPAEPTTVDSHVTIVRPVPGKFCPEFFGYMLVSIEESLKVAGEGCGGQTELGRSALAERFLVRYPEDTREQKRIADILDEAFEAIATAKRDAEKNLRHARALFESYLQSVFNQPAQGWVEKRLGEVCDLFQGLAINAKSKHLLVPHSSLPLLRIKDLRSGSAEQYVAEQGYPVNARVDESEIIYTRTGQIGLVFRGRVGILHNNCFKVRPKPVLCDDYLFWWLQTPDFRSRVTKLASKAAQPDITHSIFKAQSILVPPRQEQESIASVIEQLSIEAQHLESIYQRKLSFLDELKKSLLHSALSGELSSSDPTVIPITTAAGNQRRNAEGGLTTTDLHAGILALAYRAHERSGKLSNFGHVKAEKVAHMVEARLGLDLGRTPVKDAAGPNDYPHLKRVEHRARHARFFDFQRHGSRYVVSPLRGFDRLIERTRDDLGEQYEDVVRLIDLMVRLDTERAEIVATVYAAWNNLLLDELPATDEDIVRAAREDWHPDKLKIERDRFFSAIGWMRDQGLIPTGTGRRVADKPASAKPGRKRK